MQSLWYSTILDTFCKLSLLSLCFSLILLFFSYSFPSAWNRHWQHFCDHANFQHNGFVIMDDHDDNNDAWSSWDDDDDDWDVVDHDCCHDFTSENWMRRKALIALWQTVFHRLNCPFSESSSNPLELTKRFGQTMSHAGNEIFLKNYPYR